MTMFAKTGPLAVMLALAANTAFAHVTLEAPQAQIGGSYKAALRVSHGCGGSPTIRVRVRIPEGFIGVKPMPKAGWTIETVKASPSEGVREISWSGGRLPSDWYDEFVFVGTPAADLTPGVALYFPVIQDCETGVEHWEEIPTGGEAHGVKSPAPSLELTPAAQTHHHHH